MEKQIKLLLAEDHEIMREALRSLLDEHDEYVVVAEAQNGREAIALAASTRPDVIVMDINLPELNGIEATRRLHEDFPNMHIIGLSVHEKGRMVMEMMNAGARGYLPKTSAARELIDAINTVMEGKVYVSSSVLSGLMDAQRMSSHPDDAFARLTEREREVLQLLAEGYATKEVADKLDLSVPTVHTHRQHLLQKLDARGVADLVRYAIREGITSTES
ncbi:MAG: response regulator transcription factor [Pontiellaceae bacterium]|nr:response regulator transcription factor [Pontiellaceae bacterium]MBN2783879.1 response regulator transcription factor [Pontiellaceae bacterium]